MICKIGKSLAEIENFLKEKYIQEMVLVHRITLLAGINPRQFYF